MTEPIRLEVKRNDEMRSVYLRRVLGSRVLDAMWIPAAEWDAFVAELTAAKDGS